MSSDTVFSSLVHIPCAYLHLKGYTLLAENGGVERLVHIGLCVCDIVLEAVRHRSEHIVDETENVVALGDCGNNDTHRILIIYLVNILVTDKNFAVNAVNTLNSAVYLGRLSEVLGLETLGDTLFDDLDESLTFLFFVFEDALYLVVSVGVKVVEG